MVEEIAFENSWISNFEALVTLTLDRHKAYHRASLTGLHAKFHWNPTNFLWTDERTYGRTFETGFIRSTLSMSRPNNNNWTTFYSAVIMASHCKSSPDSFDKCRRKCWVADNSQTKPTNLDCNSAGKSSYHPHPPSPFVIIQPKSCYSFTVPRRTEGWFDLGNAVRASIPSQVMHEEQAANFYKHLHNIFWQFMFH